MSAVSTFVFLLFVACLFGVGVNGPAEAFFASVFAVTLYFLGKYEY